MTEGSKSKRNIETRISISEGNLNIKSTLRTAIDKLDEIRTPDLNQHVPQTEPPQPIQILAAAGLAFLHSKSHLEAARILLENKKPGACFSQIILSAEEFGKMIMLVEFFNFSEADRTSNWLALRRRMNSHPEKIKALTSNFESVFLTCSTEKGKSLLVSDALSTEVKSFAKWIVELLRAGQLPNHMHRIRMALTYSEISDQRVISPKRMENSLTPATLEALMSVIEYAWSTIDKLLGWAGVAREQLEELYEAKTVEEEKARYVAFERTLSRGIGAFMIIFARKHFERTGQKFGHPEPTTQTPRHDPGPIDWELMLKEVFEIAASETALEPQLIDIIGLGKKHDS